MPRQDSSYKRLICHLRLAVSICNSTIEVIHFCGSSNDIRVGGTDNQSRMADTTLMWRSGRHINVNSYHFLLFGWKLKEASQIFSSFSYSPWTRLEFGGRGGKTVIIRSEKINCQEVGCGKMKFNLNVCTAGFGCQERFTVSACPCSKLP